MSDIGLASGTVKLVDYNDNWPNLFEAEQNILSKALGLDKQGIQHVGSTSIPGMVAKPILDIAVLVNSFDVIDQWKNILDNIGYTYKGIEPDLPDRRFFAKGPKEDRTVYLHVVLPKEFNGLIKFRDSLRKDKKLADRVILF